MSEPTLPASTESSQPAAPSKGKIFLRRLISSVALWSFVLLALFSGNTLLSDSLFLIVMLAIAALGLEEFYQLVAKAGYDSFRKWGLVGGVVLMASTFFYIQAGPRTELSPGKVNDFEAGILILFVLGICFRQFLSQRGGSGLLRISTTLFGLMYVPWLLNFIQKLHFFPDIVSEAGVVHRVDGNFYVL